MTLDFPAGHSADTRWFAVDADGCVALFDSGETGAVPVDAQGDGPGVEALVRAGRVRLSELLLDPAQAAAGVHRALDEIRRQQPAPGLLARLFGRKPAPAVLTDVVVFLDDVADAGPLGEGDAVVAATAGVAVLFARVDATQIEGLHAAGRCRTCIVCPDWDEEAILAAAGVYAYDNDEYDAGATPYARTSAPPTPVRLTELPADVGAALAPIALPVRFASAAEVQPAAHVACAGWVPAWLDEARRTVRPFPGQEADYKKQLADLKREFPGYAYEEPR